MNKAADPKCIVQQREDQKHFIYFNFSGIHSSINMTIMKIYNLANEMPV